MEELKQLVRAACKDSWWQEAFCIQEADRDIGIARSVIGQDRDKESVRERERVKEKR